MLTGLVCAHLCREGRKHTSVPRAEGVYGDVGHVTGPTSWGDRPHHESRAGSFPAHEEVGGQGGLPGGGMLSGWTLETQVFSERLKPGEDFWKDGLGEFRRR